MFFGDIRVKAMMFAVLTAFFSVLALSLVVPAAMVGTMALVDRLLMRLWFGPPIFQRGSQMEERPA